MQLPDFCRISTGLAVDTTTFLRIPPRFLAIGREALQNGRYGLESASVTGFTPGASRSTSMGARTKKFAWFRSR